MGDLLGGGDAEVQQASKLTGGQENLLNALTDLLVPQVGKGISPYQGQRVAGLTPTQQQAFGMAGGAFPSIGSAFDAASQGIGAFNPQQGYDFLNQAQQNLGYATQEFDPQTILDAFEPARDIAVNQFERSTVPALLERFGATSGGSGALQEQLARAGSDLSLGLSAQIAPSLVQGQQAQLNRQLQGAGLGGQLAQAPGSLAMQSLGIGAGGGDLLGQALGFGSAEQAQNQAMLTADQQRWMEGQAYNNPYLQSLAPLALGTQAFENVVTPGSQGLLGALAPALGSFAGSEAGAGAISSGLGAAFGFI